MYDLFYHNPVKVYFGPAAYDQLGAEASALGSRALLVYGGGSVRRSGLYGQIAGRLASSGIGITEAGGIHPNPATEDVEGAVALARQGRCDLIVALGGGSVIDAAKTIAAGFYYEGPCWDLVSGKAQPRQALPLIAVPTMAATGSEMNDTAVVTNRSLSVKKGWSAGLLYPRAAFLNPESTFTVSAYQTAAGSFDILSHVMDMSYFTPEPKLAMVREFMETLMRTVVHYAPIAIERPADLEARSNLLWASEWALNGFIRAGIRTRNSCHLLEHELSAYYNLTHGTGLAILTPYWMEKVRDPESDRLFHQFGTAVFGVPAGIGADRGAAMAIACLRQFATEQLGLPATLGAAGIGSEDFGRMARHAAISGAGRYRPLDYGLIKSIYEAAE